MKKFAEYLVWGKIEPAPLLESLSKGGPQGVQCLAGEGETLRAQDQAALSLWQLGAVTPGHDGPPSEPRFSHL